MNTETHEELAAFILNIGETLALFRNKNGLSQRAFSKLSGVPQKTISRIENGLEAPRLDTLFKLFKPLGLKMTLIKEDDK